MFDFGNNGLALLSGSSGAGKTTLLQVLGTLTNADQGEVYYDNTNISKLSHKELANFRNKNIGFIFQFHHLLPEFTALENVCMPAFISRIPKKKAEEKVSKRAYFALQDKINKIT